MPLTFDISSRLRPVIVREVEMYDNHSVASGSDCSSSQTSIKIRILPRSTAWNSAPEREDDPWTPRSVAQPAKRGVLSVQIRRQSDDQQQPSKQQKVCGQVAADGGRKRRHISVRRLAFNCLSAKSASVDHYDVADCGAEQPSDDVTLRSPQFTATKVVSRSAGFSFRGENVRHSIGNGLPSSPPSSAAASIDLRHSDVGQQQVAVGQQFSVNFSTTAVLPAVRRQEDDCLCAAAAASSPPVPSSSAIIRHHCQVPMSRTAADTTVARTPGTRHQAQSQQPHPAGSYHLARQQSANHPVTSASGQRHRSSVAAPTSSGNSLVTRRTITDFEAAELSGYQHVYYIGDAACDRKWAVSESGKTDVLINNGLYYDDADGFYNFVPHDHIAYR